jgi:hypothetical protein
VGAGLEVKVLASRMEGMEAGTEESAVAVVAAALQRLAAAEGAAGEAGLTLGGALGEIEVGLEERCGQRGQAWHADACRLRGGGALPWRAGDLLELQCGAHRIVLGQRAREGPPSGSGARTQPQPNRRYQHSHEAGQTAGGGAGGGGRLARPAVADAAFATGHHARGIRQMDSSQLNQAAQRQVAAAEGSGRGRGRGSNATSARARDAATVDRRDYAATYATPIDGADARAAWQLSATAAPAAAAWSQVAGALHGARHGGPSQAAAGAAEREVAFASTVHASYAWPSREAPREPSGSPAHSRVTVDSRHARDALNHTR